MNKHFGFTPIFILFVVLISVGIGFVVMQTIKPAIYQAPTPPGIPLEEIIPPPTSVSNPTNLCDSKPDPGICKAAFQKFYFDKETKSCKEFTWGGCGGVVPFETLSDCKQKCEI